MEIEKIRTALEDDQKRLQIVNDDIEVNKQDYEQTKEEYEQIENTIEQLNSIIDSSKMRYMRTNLPRSVRRVR